MSIEPDRLVSAREDSSEAGLDRALRPERLTDYVGQGPVKEQMSIFIEAARQRGEARRLLREDPPHHLLFSRRRLR